MLYTADRNGTVVAADAPDSLLPSARARRLAIIPTIQNYRGDSWDGALIAAILGDPSQRSRHVHQLVRLMRHNHWSGIDIDYENLAPTESAN